MPAAIIRTTRQRTCRARVSAGTHTPGAKRGSNKPAPPPPATDQPASNELKPVAEKTDDTVAVLAGLPRPTLLPSGAVAVPAELLRHGGDSPIEEALPLAARTEDS